MKEVKLVQIRWNCVGIQRYTDPEPWNERESSAPNRTTGLESFANKLTALTYENKRTKIPTIKPSAENSEESPTPRHVGFLVGFLMRILENYLSIGIGIFLFIACGKGDTLDTSNEVTPNSSGVLQNSEASLSDRITKKSNELEVNANASGLLTQSEEYRLVLIGEASAPVFEGETLQATDVYTNGSYAVVSYNLAGNSKKGGIEIFDVSDEALNDGGLKLFRKEDGNIVASIDAEVVNGKDTSLTVANAATLHEGLIFKASGEASVYVTKKNSNLKFHNPQFPLTLATATLRGHAMTRNVKSRLPGKKTEDSDHEITQSLLKPTSSPLTILGLNLVSIWVRHCKALSG